ncbi:hypothetical protein O6H91_14G023500 [Diphasiastrum complanatum]|uniref:Uncharacterized protein n=1 Tax=Diphasiastrum complanatum TaxID=34168 RepID=A0ACC2BMB8_DIPCM|nr:hypothetical protein O6H91_14G023500 [Diphasiastrum complanatum]
MMSSTMNVIMTVLGFAVSTTFIVFVCARLFCARMRRRRRTLILTPEMEFNPRAIERTLHGIEPTLVTSFPTIKYCQETFASRDDAMCTVCLAEYEDKEVLRVLPKCGHAFHIACIDAWLRQNATCPICRISLRMSPEIGVPHPRINLEGRQWVMPRITSANLFHAPHCSPSSTAVLNSTVSEQIHLQHMLYHYSADSIGDPSMSNTPEGHVLNEATNNVGINSGSNFVNNLDIGIISESRGTNRQVENDADNELIRERSISSSTTRSYMNDEHGEWTSQIPGYSSFWSWRSSKEEELRPGAWKICPDGLSMLSATTNTDINLNSPHGEVFTTASSSDCASAKSNGENEKKSSNDQCTFADLEGQDFTSKEFNNRVHEMEIV